MAQKPDHLVDDLEDNTGGLLSGLLADEDDLDRRALWRLGSWGLGAIGAVILAVIGNQSSLGIKRDQVAAADLSRQSQQIQMVAKKTQNEARRLGSAIDTLNSDRDRLYSRVTSLEQGLDSVTGAIARQGSGPSPPATAEPQAGQKVSAPAVAPVTTSTAAAPVSDKSAIAEPGPATVSAVAKDAAKTEIAKPETAKPDIAKPDIAKADTAKPDSPKPETAKPSPAIPLMAAKSFMSPPDPAAAKLIEPNKTPSHITVGPIPEVVASAPSADDAEGDDSTAPKVVVRRTEFGVDLGSANSVNGLRALWRGLLKSKSNAPLIALRPIIVVRESTNSLGMQLRLVAGPINDAGAAARICAVLTENSRSCETAIFDGQRLTMKSDDPPQATTKPTSRRRSSAKRSIIVAETPRKPETPTTTTTTLSSFFGRRNSQ